MPQQPVEKKTKRLVKQHRNRLHTEVTVTMEIPQHKDPINIQGLKQASTIIPTDKEATNTNIKAGNILKEVIAVTINGAPTEEVIVTRM